MVWLRTRQRATRSLLWEGAWDRQEPLPRGKWATPWPDGSPQDHRPQRAGRQQPVVAHRGSHGLAVSGDGELRAGQTLSIPKLALNANNADTFQPYDPSRVTSSLRSVLPAPVLAALSAQRLRLPAPP